MEAYLDNSATTRCCEEAAQLVVKLLTEDYGNPSSLHNKGVIAENYMNNCKDIKGTGKRNLFYVRWYRVQ